MDRSLMPMLATPGKAFPSNPSNYFIEPKYDGWRYIVHKDESGELRCYGGRNGSDYSRKLPYLEAQLLDMLPAGTVLDGELVGVDDSWGDVQSVMTSNGAVQGEPLNYHVFDIPRLCLRDIRRTRQEQRTQALDVFDWDDYPALERVPSCEAQAAHHTQFVAQGFEGSVWKAVGATYASGTRSPGWLKFKTEVSSEAVVTGFKPGQGEFAGMIGAIEFELIENGAKSRASGMDLSTRQDMTDNPAAWIGSVIEVKHNGIMRSGAPRHPQFLRRRDDRAAADAVGQALRRDAKPVMPRAKRARPASGAGIKVAGASKRNYGAMGDNKLLAAIGMLEGGYGDAYERCVGAGCDPNADLKKASAIAKERGLL